jgi:hypothetical protein
MTSKDVNANSVQPSGITRTSETLSAFEVFCQSRIGKEVEDFYVSELSFTEWLQTTDFFSRKTGADHSVSWVHAVLAQWLPIKARSAFEKLGVTFRLLPIGETIAQANGEPVTTGYMSDETNDGQYNPQTRVMTLRADAGAATIVHESGHALFWGADRLAQLRMDRVFTKALLTALDAYKKDLSHPQRYFVSAYSLSGSIELGSAQEFGAECFRAYCNAKQPNEDRPAASAERLRCLHPTVFDYFAKTYGPAPMGIAL